MTTRFDFTETRPSFKEWAGRRGLEVRPDPQGIEAAYLILAYLGETVAPQLRQAVADQDRERALLRDRVCDIDGTATRQLLQLRDQLGAIRATARGAWWIALGGLVAGLGALLIEALR